MDIWDRAQEADAKHRARALAAQQKRTGRGRGAAACIDCGAPIPAARREADVGAVRCVACQAEFE